MVSKISVKLGIMKCATDPRQEADKISRLAQLQYKKHADRRVLSISIPHVSDYVFLGRLFLFCMAVKRFVPENYNKLLPPKQGAHQVFGTNIASKTESLFTMEQVSHLQSKIATKIQPIDKRSRKIKDGGRVTPVMTMMVPTTYMS